MCAAEHRLSLSLHLSDISGGQCGLQHHVQVDQHQPWVPPGLLWDLCSSPQAPRCHFPIASTGRQVCGWCRWDAGSPHELGSSTGGPKAWVGRAFAPGGSGEHGWESWHGSAESSPPGFGFIMGVAKKSTVEKPPDISGNPPAICL